MKTEIDLFTRKYNTENFKGSILNGVELQLFPEEDFFGVILKQKFKLKRYIA